MRVQANNQIFTPAYIVAFMLDEVGYNNEAVLTTKFMEPSFGDGAFLVPMVERIIEFCLKHNLEDDIVDVILQNVYGFEKDRTLYEKTIYNLNSLLSSYNLPALDWSRNLICGNTLVLSKRYNKKFDLVIGNPPYTRVHSLTARTKKTCDTYQFSKGLKELYVIFYEAGLNMLNDTGRLCFITPNSFMYNASQSLFRQYLINNSLLKNLYDFKSRKIFDADTYTCICTLDKCQHSTFAYYNAYDDLPGNETVYDFEDLLAPEQPWRFGSKRVSTYNTELGENFYVQYGVATNADHVFIGKCYLDKECKQPLLTLINAPAHVYFNKTLIESSILRPAIKASTYNGTCNNSYIIFPYRYENDKCILLSEETVMLKYPQAYQYLQRHRKTLCRRNTNEAWYAFGRTQGLNNMSRPKLVIKHIIPNNDLPCEAFLIDENAVVYSGLFITTINADLNVCRQVLNTLEFKEYCCLVGKPMANDYISINGKNIKSYKYK